MPRCPIALTNLTEALRHERFESARRDLSPDKCGLHNPKKRARRAEPKLREAAPGEELPKPPRVATYHQTPDGRSPFRIRPHPVRIRHYGHRLPYPRFALETCTEWC